MLSKMSRSTLGIQRGRCVGVNKDGRRHQQRKHDGCPESTVSHHNGSSIMAHDEKAGECPEQDTHTPLRVRTAVWRRSKSKTGRVVLPIFLPFSLLLLFHRARLAAAEGNISCIGELPDGCMNNIFGHNGKQSIGRLICSGPRIGSNRTAAIQAITATDRPITAHHLRCHWPLIRAIMGSADLHPMRSKYDPADDSHTSM